MEDSFEDQHFWDFLENWKEYESREDLETVDKGVLPDFLTNNL